MQYQLILANIAKYIDLTEQEKQYLKNILVPFTTKPKQFLLKEGQIASGIYFVNDGCLRMYNKDKNGVAHISFFSPKDWWMSDLLSYHTKQGSAYFIDAILPTNGWFLSFIKLEQMYIDIPKFERFFRIIIEKHSVANQKRLLETMTDNAEERYLKFAKRYPMIVNTIAQKHIAAYIGVTPEFLSKMRSQMARKNLL